MDFLDVASRVVKNDEGSAEETHDSFVVQSMSQLAEIAEKYHVSEEEQAASIIAMAAIEKARQNDPQDEQEKGTNALFKFMHWLEKKAERFIVKWIFKSIWKLVKWLVKEVVVGSLRLMVNWLIRPMITEGLGFLILNPEISIPLIAAVGVGGLGYLIYKKFFAEPTPEELAARQTNIVEETQERLRPETPVPAGQPEGIRPLSSGQLLREGVSSRLTSLQSLISRGEGSYNSVNLGAAHGYRASTRDLEHMTVAEVMQHQVAGDFNAAGKYQIIKSTLASAYRALGLTGNEKFDAATQDRIFESYLIGQKRHQIADYIAGRTDNLNAAVLAASQEWASVAAPPGYQTQNGRISDGTISYYTGIANNRASINAFEMARVLQEERIKATGQRLSTSIQSGIATDKLAVPSAQSTAQRQGQGQIMRSQSNAQTPVTDIVRGPQNTLIALR